MAVKKRCDHCLKKLKQLSENQWVCENHPLPIYYPPLVTTEQEDTTDDTADK